MARSGTGARLDLARQAVTSISDWTERLAALGAMGYNQMIGVHSSGPKAAMNWSILPEAIVLSLPHEAARRVHIARHFADAGIVRYRFAEALPAGAPEVRQAYAAGRVAEYPPCFRCGQDNCGCANNILIPSQVANFLSFARIWASLATGAPERLALICEDDVLFYRGAVPRLAEILAGLTPPDGPLLIRLSQSGRPTDVEIDAPLETSTRVVMSNPAYILNGAMAAHLVARLGRIDTTSDIWLHRDAARHPEVWARTINPLIATELSYNPAYARFVSAIHPKGITPEDAARVRRHVMRATVRAEYMQVHGRWKTDPSALLTCRTGTGASVEPVSEVSGHPAPPQGERPQRREQ